MNKTHLIDATDHELAVLTKGMNMIQTGPANNYWQGDDLKYTIIFDNANTTRKVYEVTPL